MIKRFALTAGLLLMLTLSFVAFGGSASAAPQTPAKDAVAFCQQLQAEGVLADAGVTFGECVNIFKGPASENANNFISGLCGIDFVQAEVGATNKGQCIKIVKTLFS